METVCLVKEQDIAFSAAKTTFQPNAILYSG